MKYLSTRRYPAHCLTKPSSNKSDWPDWLKKEVDETLSYMLRDYEDTIISEYGEWPEGSCYWVFMDDGELDYGTDEEFKRWFVEAP